MLYPVKGEPIVTDSHGTQWEYVYDKEMARHTYLHRACDTVCDKEGYCIMCGAPCPTIWTCLPKR
jgi:hypothetical protein